jgi:hypothetical protein
MQDGNKDRDSYPPVGNLIHPARALREGYNPRTFTQEQLEELKEMYRSITHSLLYYL